MAQVRTRTDLPILLLHNVDHSWTGPEIEEVEQAVSELQTAVAELGHPVVSAPLHNPDLPSLLRQFDPDDYVVLNWCEAIPGISHSDYRVAQMLEDSGFTFTGACADALAFSWDKPRVKERLTQHGITIPRWRLYSRAQKDGWNCFPAIVKASLEHSSVGISTESVVLSPDEMEHRIEYVLDTYAQPAIVEDFIDGREFYVPVFGDGDPHILAPVEMDYGFFQDVHQRLCTFDAKFTPGSNQYEEINARVPADLTPYEYAQLERICLAAFTAVQCRDYARMDVRLRDGIFYVIDVNPNADISADASIARAAAAEGYTYGQMISHLITLAAERHPRFKQHWF
jgi:D-alanine-D-alanine ligase